ncbi:MAG: hypothetical protein EOO20_27905, partial [Chryseobacterium sp.]
MKRRAAYDELLQETEQATPRSWTSADKDIIDFMTLEDDRKEYEEQDDEHEDGDDDLDEGDYKLNADNLGKDWKQIT